jgi:hypothetical protein
MDIDYDYNALAIQRQRIMQSAALVIGTVTSSTLSLLKQAFPPPKPRYPYHTSILTGEGWVLELLAGHPQRIRTELGVGHQVFHRLITTLQSFGLKNSRHVLLEEQLAIFLYASVTGLSVRHLGERFQRSNETISL